jgi:hypothetical protein
VTVSGAAGISVVEGSATDRVSGVARLSERVHIGSLDRHMLKADFGAL